MRAIDLYSGIGGWSLGLKMAGVEVVDSYERWAPANETNFRNNGHHANVVDIRTLELDRLPHDIDLVVGSPPCTQFSLSNRGGAGNIADGLVDIIKFLTIVEHLRPRFWAMENVPRVATIVRQELREGGVLNRFKDLGVDVRVMKMEDFGLPQRRHRCIAGNIDFDLLESYRPLTPRPTLGDVLSALALPSVVDPSYGTKVSKVHDHVVEDFLTSEEVRLNKAAKTAHPVYNAMPFPDPPTRQVRTITATCTRVSRESVIISDLENAASLRRLTIRERASLQGFPINFQFYGRSHGQKLTMVGNAVPPLFSFYIGQAVQGVEAVNLRSPKQGIQAFSPPTQPPPYTEPERPGLKYPRSRTFRMAIPSLRLKSGVRFELANVFGDGEASWGVAFIFGSSKDIQRLPLSPSLGQLVRETLDEHCWPGDELSRFEAWLADVDWPGLQRIWSHKGPGATHPFALLETIDDAGKRVSSKLEAHPIVTTAALSAILEAQLGPFWHLTTGVPKLVRNPHVILAGLIVGSLVNASIRGDKGEVEPNRKFA